ncbi:hypothetical protein V7S43_000319 [Phytophthora oleae]|uniref:Peptidase S33 tripeptidyl aminopeptidase-like C-terminal domain-containing protein n=1 Tax=Phytophthora oleae TaxID=2107226 RepID=A0ABD3G5Y8_9STRA
MSKFTSGASTILYGGSYGTILVERIMHLDPPGVTGYVMDGIATTSGAPGGEFFFMSKRDDDFGEVDDHFLTLCTLDPECKRHFKSPNALAKTLRGVLADFEKNPNSTCTPLVKSVDGDDYPPSSQLRITLGTMVMDPEIRKLIPPLIYRLKRCSKADIDVLKQFTGMLKAYSATKIQDDALYSPLLFYLVTFSELWENPQPSLAVMKARFAKASIAAGNVDFLYLYCAFSKEKSPACAQVKDSKYAAHGIIYDHDEYWNKTTTIPRKAGVLLLSSKLDAQTPHKYAEYLLESLRGDQKELVTFNYSVHGAIVWTQLKTGNVACGIKIIASYVSSNGDLKGIDKSCVDEMPAFNLTVPVDYQINYFSTDDVYDGVYDENLGEQSTEAAA